MDQISLEPLDTPILSQTNFGPDQNRWITNIVDIINANFTIIVNNINYFNSFITNLITSSGIDVGGSGEGPISVSVIGLTPSGYVNVTIISTSIAGVTVASIVPGTNSFSITFSADPGASAIIVYQAFITQPQ